MSKPFDPLTEALTYADAHVAQRSDINTEIQHPTDLITMEPYYSLTMLLLKLDVLPADVHLMTCKWWDSYNY